MYMSFYLEVFFQLKIFHSFQRLSHLIYIETSFSVSTTDATSTTIIRIGKSNKINNNNLSINNNNNNSVDYNNSNINNDNNNIIDIRNKIDDNNNNNNNKNIMVQTLFECIFLAGRVVFFV